MTVQILAKRESVRISRAFSHNDLFQSSSRKCYKSLGRLMSSIAMCRCAEINAICQENLVIFEWLYRQPILLYKHTKKRNITILVDFFFFIRKRHVLIYKRMTSNKVDNTMIQSVHLMYIKSKTVKFEVFGGIYSTAQSGLTYLCHVTQIT